MNNFYLTINLCTASATDIIGDYINAFRIITNDVDAITHVIAIFPDNIGFEELHSLLQEWLNHGR